jgi:phosphoglycolate phosphatase
MVGDGVATLVARAFAARDRAPDDAALRDFSADYGSHVAVESRPFPNVDVTLSGLVRQGWTLAVCTNKPERAARDLLAAMHLLPLIAAIGGGDSFPVRKPDSAHLLATLERVGAEPRCAVALGDNRNDILAAYGAGVASIFAAWGYGPLTMAEGSAAVAHDITEAAEIANRLMPPDCDADRHKPA